MEAIQSKETPSSIGNSSYRTGRNGKKNWCGRWRDKFKNLKLFMILKEVLYCFWNKRI